MKEDDIENARVAGEIILVLKHGTEQEKQSLLTAIEQAAGLDERIRIEAWLNGGLEGA